MEAAVPRLIKRSLVLQQEELSKTDQEVMRCKHHKKHYDEKRSAHLSNINTLEANLASKEQELQVSLTGFFKNIFLM